MNEGVVRRALVTGGTGFVGGHLTRALLASGWEVHLIVLPDAGLGTIADLEGQVFIYPHDGSTEQMIAIVAQAKPEMVFHLASLIPVQHTPAEVEPLIRSNVLFATQLAEAMVRAGCHRLVNTGTSWEHYENKDYCPVNLYAASKQAFEVLLEFYLETTPLKAITLKLFDTYGPNDPRPKLFALLLKVAREGIPLAMSPGEQLVDLVHVDDVVRAFIMASERLLGEAVVTHERYAVSSGKPMPLRDLVELVGRITGKFMPVEWGGRPYRPREVMRPWDTGKALPGWQPQVALEEGIQRFLPG